MADDVGSADSLDPIEILAERPSAEFDEVKLQADYTARALLSFYRFRQLGGGRMREDDGTPNIDRKLTLGKVEKNGVHYVSDHPDVRILQLSVIALLVLFESAANAYFFAQQSAFGISGGLFQAAAVSLANVATSFFIVGYWGLRHASTPANWSADPRKWDARNYYKLFGIFAIIVGVIIALLVNLSAAHYRNLIDMQALTEIDPASAEALAANTTSVFRFAISTDVCDAILTSPLGLEIGSAATNAMCRPFALHSLDAMVLFALGVAISALAAFEGRGADAAFPGLSDAARQAEKAKQDLTFALEDYYDTIDDFVAEARTIMSGDIDKEDQPDGYDPRQLGYSGMTMQDELRLRALLRARVEPFRSLLTSDPDLLSDEFGVEREIVLRLGRARGGQ
ncbi:MAG: hypothetical protein AAFS03_07455 [Pseudomonadota bacterium]